MFESKCFEVIVWVESYDCEHIKDTCDKYEYIKQYAFALHDKDENKKPHYHIMLQTYETQPSTRIAKDFCVLENAVEKCKSTKKTHQFDDMLLYLIHFNAPDKFQYDVSSVVSNMDYAGFIEKKKQIAVSKARENEIRQLIIDGVIKEYNVTKFVTPLEFERFKKSITSAFEFRRRMVTSSNRNMNVIYICGGTGRGKTTFAKERALSAGYEEPFISSAGNDLFDNYKGQPCVILDDLRGSMFRFDEIIKLTDNHTNSTVKSRYNNKDLVECKLLIITSSETIEQFAHNTEFYNNEDICQLKRRCGTYIRYDDDFYYVSAWETNKNSYSQELKFKNEIRSKFADDENSIEKSLSLLGLDMQNALCENNDFVSLDKEECKQVELLFNKEFKND